MTDQDIEKLALDRFQNANGFDYEMNERVKLLGIGFIEGAKAMRDRFKHDIIEAYCEGFTSTDSVEQYYKRKYNDTDSNRSEG